MTKEATWGSNSGAAGHRDINWKVHFYIDKAGATGDEIVPSSPKDWLNFIDWEESGVTNRKAYNTFKYAGKMTLYGVEVTKMELPMREIDAIAKEYNKRENGEVEEEEKSDTDESEIEDFLTEETSTSDDSFLNEDENSSDITDDSFLTESDDEDFLSSGGQDDFLEGTSNNTTSHKIDYKGTTQGVIDEKTGKVLIPYRNWKINEFIDGVAKVSIEIDSYECKGNVTAYKVGYVDKTGEYLDGYDIDFTYYGEFVQPAYLKLVRYDADYVYDAEKERRQKREEERRERERKEKNRRERERCDREIENWKSQIINQYK